MRFPGELTLLEALKSFENNDISSQASLESHRENVRRKLLASSARVTAYLLPDLSALIAKVSQRLGVQQDFEVYVFEEANINAYVTPGAKHFYVALSSGAVNGLSAAELEFIVGHELGHMLLGHVTGQAYRLTDGQTTRAEKFQCNHFALKRAQEISADRCGLVACGSVEVAASSMLRTLSGLTSPALRIRPEDFAEQWEHLLEEIREAGGDDKMSELTHPLLPLRVRALMMLWDSDAVALAPYRPGGTRTLTSVNEEVERLLSVMRRSEARREGGLLQANLVGLLAMSVVYTSGMEGESVAEDIVHTLVARGDLSEQVRQDPASAEQQFRHALESRTRKVKALEAYDLVERAAELCAPLLCSADDAVARKSLDALDVLASLVSVNRSVCEGFVKKMKEK